MSILKSVALRIFDFAVIGALIYGDQNMQLLGLWVAAIFTVVVWIGVFGMKPEAAKEIHGPLIKVAFGVAVNLGYTYALIVSGNPVWGAFYCLGFLMVRRVAAKVVNAPSA